VELYRHSPNTPSMRGALLKKSTGTTLPYLPGTNIDHLIRQPVISPTKLPRLIVLSARNKRTINWFKVDSKSTQLHCIFATVNKSKKPNPEPHLKGAFHARTHKRFPDAFFVNFNPCLFLALVYRR